MCFFCFFFYLSINLNNNILILDIYDRRRNFNFHTQLLSHWFTNLRKKVFINIIKSQLNRYFKICNNKENLSKQIFRITSVMYYYNFYLYSPLYDLLCINMSIFFNSLWRRSGSIVSCGYWDVDMHGSRWGVASSMNLKD